MEVRIPRTSLIVLCGTAGCGKSTFACRNFKSTEVVSSDRCRALVSDDEENMEASKEAFELFYFMIEKRMKMGRLVVADSTALTHEARKKLLHIGRNNNYYTILVAFNVSLNKAIEQNNMRYRRVSEKVIERQYSAFKKSLKYMDKEGFDKVIILKEDALETLIFSMISGENHGRMNIDTGIFLKSLTFKSRTGLKIRLGDEEVREAVDFLKSKPVDTSWVIHVPPVIPSIHKGSFEQQLNDTVSYYTSRGISTLVAENRLTLASHVIVLYKDKTCSQVYSSGNSVGQIYSLFNNQTLDNVEKEKIITRLYSEFTDKEYFQKHNTEFTVFEVNIIKDGDNSFIIPLKLICHSFSSFLKRDNIWQIENTGKMCEDSKIMRMNDTYVLEDKASIETFISRIVKKDCSNVVIKPVVPGPQYRGKMVQPEILCTAYPLYAGEERFKLSGLAYELCTVGLDKFIKNKLSNRYFKYIIGCVAINNKVME